MKMIESKKNPNKENHVDYDFSWDYEETRVKKEDVELVQDIVSQIEKLDIEWLDNFILGFIKGINDEALAVYIDGSSSYPHVGLDLNLLKKICKKENLDLRKQIFISICHELYHAFQDLNDEEYDCEEAESFAVGCYFDFKMNRKPINIEQSLIQGKIV